MVSIWKQLDTDKFQGLLILGTLEFFKIVFISKVDQAVIVIVVCSLYGVKNCGSFFRVFRFLFG